MKKEKQTIKTKHFSRFESDLTENTFGKRSERNVMPEPRDPPDTDCPGQTEGGAR